MQIFVILAILILIFAVVFALQNTIGVAVTFLFWQFHGSLALVLIVAVLAGLVISFLAYLPSLLRSHMAGRKLHKQIADLESNLAEHKQRLADALIKVQDQSAAAKPPQQGEAPTNPPATSK
jgi:putative membrane protein